ncbi:hypothetical protein R3P38DRAFT_3255116 [Favolaschia claudopus]|uniref:Uncharacterized protein n=1 Tax=Favolaschia claudopus TaxID=2862362 RepID=A0AAW0DIR0_9AGAR
MADSSKVKKKEISDGSSHGVRTSRASAHSNFSSSASTARLDLLTDSSDERTDYVSQRNRRDGNKCQRLPRHRRLPPVIKTAPSALLQNVQFFRSQCPSPPGGTDSPPLRSTILGSFLGRGRPPQFFSIAYRRIESQSPPRCTGQRAQPIASSAAQRPHPKLWRCKHVPVQHKDSLAAPPSSLMWRIYLRPRHTPRKSQVRRHTFLRFSLIQGHRRRLPSPAPALLHACLLRVEPVDDPSPGFRIIPAWRDTFSRLRSSAFSTVSTSPTSRPAYAASIRNIHQNPHPPFPLPNCLPLPSRLTCQDSLLRPLSHRLQRAARTRSPRCASRLSHTHSSPALPTLSTPSAPTRGTPANAPLNSQDLPVGSLAQAPGA